MIKQLQKKLNHPHIEIYGYGGSLYIHDGMGSMIGYLGIAQGCLLIWDSEHIYEYIPLADPELIAKARNCINQVVLRHKAGILC